MCAGGVHMCVCARGAPRGPAAARERRDLLVHSLRACAPRPHEARWTHASHRPRALAAPAPGFFPRACSRGRAGVKLAPPLARRAAGGAFGSRRSRRAPHGLAPRLARSGKPCVIWIAGSRPPTSSTGLRPPFGAAPPPSPRTARWPAAGWRRGCARAISTWERREGSVGNGRRPATTATPRPSQPPGHATHAPAAPRPCPP